MGCKQSHGFLEGSWDSFLAQVLDRTSRRGTLLLHISKEDLIKEVTAFATPTGLTMKQYSFRSWEKWGKTVSWWSHQTPEKCILACSGKWQAVQKNWCKGWRTLCFLSLGLARSALRHTSSLHLLVGSGEVLPTTEESSVRCYLTVLSGKGEEGGPKRGKQGWGD